MISPARNQVSLALVCLVVFVSLMGAGIVVPLFPFFGAQFGATPAEITHMVAAFSLGQLVSTPFWGWLSDRIGRKPVLILSLAGATGAYVVMGLASSIEMLQFSRLLGGLASGIGAVAFAAAADLSGPADRAKAIGRVGAATALGFIVGPAVGGLLAGTDPANASYLNIALFAGGLDLLALLLALWLLPETHPPEARAAATQDAPPAQWRDLLRDPVLWRMNAVGLLGSAGMAVVDSTFPLYADRALGLSPREIGLMFAAMAGTNALLQALAVGPAMTRFGAVSCLRISLTVYAAGCVIVALSGSIAGVMVGLLVLAFAYALFLAPASQVVSNEVGAGDRGAALGMFQGAGNVGRFMTPLVSGLMFSTFGASSPFVGAALLMIPALIATGGIRRLAGIR